MDNSCTICLSPLSPSTCVTLVPCEHTSFCFDCIQLWQKEAHRNRRTCTCPLCRRNIEVVITPVNERIKIHNSADDEFLDLWEERARMLEDLLADENEDEYEDDEGEVWEVSEEEIFGLPIGIFRTSASASTENSSGSSNYSIYNYSNSRYSRRNLDIAPDHPLLFTFRPVSVLPPDETLVPEFELLCSSSGGINGLESASRDWPFDFRRFESYYEAIDSYIEEMGECREDLAPLEIMYFMENLLRIDPLASVNQFSTGFMRRATKTRGKPRLFLKGT
ncbi:hypothetical protein BDD12DRAFT_808364 [Trichophaea hybrida]|nr:hypothetical protein BDD12DRAFT_808364 [Trichophaea hybrida]